MRVVGVTGTNGKTSTVRLLGAIGRQAGLRTLTTTSLGVQLDGVDLETSATSPAELLEALGSGVELAVLELTSRALAEGAARGLRLDAAVLLNLTEDHLDLHGTMHAYLAAKQRIFDALRPGGAAVLGGDDPVLRSRGLPVGRAVPVRWFGLESHAVRGPHLRATDVRLSHLGTRMALAGPLSAAIPAPLEVALIGRPFARNALAAAVAAHLLRIEGGLIQEGLRLAAPVPGRFQVVARAPLVVVDFAHTPAALRDALESARSLTQARVLVVFGAGGDRMKQKRPTMGRIAGELADAAWITSDNPRGEEPLDIARAVAAGWEGTFADAPWIELHRPSAIEAALDDADPEDVVLIAGMGSDPYEPEPGDGLVTDESIVRALAGAHS